MNNTLLRKTRIAITGPFSEMENLKTDAYDRSQRRNMSCALFVSLLPFFLSTALYLYWWIDSPPSIVAADVRAAPILFLAAVVLSWNGGQSAAVVGGLLFSAVGDCCLIWPDSLLQVSGIGAFAVAHLLYSVSFLSSRYAPHSSSSSSWIRVLYLILIAVGGGFYVYLCLFLEKASDILILGVYICVILLMVCLAIRTRHTVTVLGGLIFVVSDASLALLAVKLMTQAIKVLPEKGNGHLVVMVTYYMAQLLIAVGDVMTVEDGEGVVLNLL